MIEGHRGELVHLEIIKQILFQHLKHDTSVVLMFEALQTSHKVIIVSTLVRKVS